MNKLVSLCFSISNFATLELYDTNGNITDPLNWCDQSDPVKAAQFEKAMTEKYNEMLKNPNAYTSAYSSVNLIAFHNAYKLYKQYKIYKAYEKSKKARSITHINKNIFLFLIPKDLCERLILHDDIHNMILSGNFESADIINIIRAHTGMRIPATQQTKSFYDNARIIEFYDIAAAIQYNDTSPSNKIFDNIGEFEFKDLMKAIIKHEHLQNAKIVMKKRRLHDNKVVNNAFNNAKIEFDSEYGHIIQSITCEENLHDASRIVWINAFTNLACIHGDHNYHQRNNSIALKIPNIRNVKINKPHHSYGMTNFANLLEKMYYTPKYEVKCDLSMHPILYFASSKTKIFIKNESKYPAAIHIHYDLLPLTQYIFDGKFHFISISTGSNHVSFTANATCKTLLISEDTHIKRNLNVANIINVNLVNLNKANYYGIEYCNDMRENYKQSNNMPDFKDWIKSYDLAQRVTLEDDQNSTAILKFNNSASLQYNEFKSNIYKMSDVKLACTLMHLSNKMHKQDKVIQKMEIIHDKVQMEINKLWETQCSLTEKLTTLNEKLCTASEDEIILINEEIAEINNKLDNINFESEHRKYILRTERYGPYASITQEGIYDDEKLCKSIYSNELEYRREKIYLFKQFRKFIYFAYSFISVNTKG